MSVLSDLTLWYTAQCNGEWEHRQGISVESTDNPGWWVKVDIRETPLHGRAFAPVEATRTLGSRRTSVPE